MQKNRIILIASVFALTLIILSFNTGLSMPWCGDGISCDECTDDSDCGTGTYSCQVGDSRCECTYSTSCKTGMGGSYCANGGLIGQPKNCITTYDSSKTPNFVYGQKNMTSKELESNLSKYGAIAISSNTVTSFIAYVKPASPCMPNLVNGTIKDTYGTTFRPGAGNIYLITVRQNAVGDGYNAYFARLNGTNSTEGNCTLAFCDA